MTYQSIVEIAGSMSLQDRISACAASEAVPDPVQWTQSNRWVFASQPGWADAWESAKAAYTVDFNPDTGVRGDVITDAMILAAVQAVYVP